MSLQKLEQLAPQLLHVQAGVHAVHNQGNTSCGDAQEAIGIPETGMQGVNPLLERELQRLQVLHVHAHVNSEQQVLFP
jgi:hypothetical protein